MTGEPDRSRGHVPWRELLSETAAVLGDRQRAWWVCEVASGYDGDELTAELDHPAAQRSVAHLDAMVDRARAGEPLQYVLGRWGFRRLDLAVDPRVLIPRPETELLVDVTLGLLRERIEARRSITVADLGTGSGAIGLALADELPVDRATVWLTDVDPDALDVARSNLAGIGRAAANVRTAQGSWLEPFDSIVARGAPIDPTFDVIVSNPPYVAERSDALEPIVADHEPSAALFGGPDGLDHIRTIVADAPRWLAREGSLVLEVGSDQGRAVEALLIGAGFGSVEIRRDLAGHERVAVATR